MSTDLHSALRAVIEQRLEVARAASTRARAGATPTGEHWRWECSTCDAPIDITPVTVLDELMRCETCESYSVDIRSVEQYETNSVGELPHMVTHGADEVRPVDGLFMVTHDPADAIRRYERDLMVLERHRITDDGEGQNVCDACGWLGTLTDPDECDELRDLLDVYPEVTHP